MLSALASPTLSVISAMRQLPVGIKPDDIVLASFPKSGNTWFRFIFANLLRVRERCQQPVNFHNIELFSPAVGGRFSAAASPISCEGPRLIKTHHNWSLRYRKHRSILLIRDPVDCLPAYFGYLTEAHNVHYSGMASFLSSWRHGFPAWTSFHRSWQGRADFILRYDDLLRDPAVWVNRICIHFGLDYSVDEISKALSESSREAMKRAESEGDPYHDGNYTFVRGARESRKGVAISEPELKRIEASAASLMRALQSGAVSKK